MKRTKIIIAVVVAVVAVATLQFLRAVVAPIPAAFVNTNTLASALANSRTSGKPVLAFVTADWCGPCQSLKRGALVDEKVAAAIREKTHPVYIDATHDSAEAVELGASGMPVLILLRPTDDGQRELSRLVGNRDPEHVLAWLAGAN
jgi:thiol:disulfide interchange protein